MKRWPLHKTDFWERAPFFRLLVPLIAGIALYPKSQIDSNIVYTIILSAVISIAIYIFVASGKLISHIYRWVSFISMHAAIFLLAWLLCYFSDVRNNQHWFGHSIDTAEQYRIQLTQPAVEKDKTWKLTVNVISSIKDNKVSAARGEAFVYVYKHSAPAMREGDIYTIPNSWQSITNRGNPFEFDYAGYCARDNIYHTAFIDGSEMTIELYGEAGHITWYKQVHYWCMDQLAMYIHDNATLGLLQAILVGDKNLLNDELTDAYANTGIVHIMAISGAHITIFFLLVAFLLGWVKHKRYHWLKYIAAIPLIWIYVVAAGVPASAVRAATMFSLLGIGFALQKQPNGINQLFATAFFLLCANPMWLYAIGFQLSFVAVLSIFLFYKPIYKLYTPVNKITKTIWSAIAVSIAAEILIAPLVIYYFHLFPLQFIIANVLAYFFMGAILVAGMVLIAISAYYPLASLLGDMITSIVTAFNQLIYLLQDINPEYFHRLTLNNLQLVLIYISIAGISVFLLLKKKSALALGSFGICLFLFSCGVEQWRIYKQQIFVVYNTTDGNYIELIEGKKATFINRHSEQDASTHEYVIKPAHINWHINDVDSSSDKKELLTINKKKVFILNQAIQDTSISADYIVLNYRAKEKDLANIKTVFNRGVLIIGTNISRSKAKKLSAKAQSLGLEIHNIREDGAFILHN